MKWLLVARLGLVVKLDPRLRDLLPRRLAQLLLLRLQLMHLPQLLLQLQHLLFLLQQLLSFQLQQPMRLLLLLPLCTCSNLTPAEAAGRQPPVESPAAIHSSLRGHAAAVVTSSSSSEEHFLLWSKLIAPAFGLFGFEPKGAGGRR
jgi:hypothetical protein